MEMVGKGTIIFKDDCTKHVTKRLESVFFFLLSKSFYSINNKYYINIVNLTVRTKKAADIIKLSY
jgi:hypothetical protein